MNGALNTLREAVAQQLRQAGVNAVTAMESGRASRAYYTLDECK